MVTKLATWSKELNWAYILGFLGSLQASGYWPWIEKIISWFPDATAETITGAIIVVIGAANWLLRKFFTKDAVTFDKTKVTTEAEIEVLTEVKELMAASPSNVVVLREAVTQVQEQKELEELQAKMARLKELEAKQKAA